jgi:dehydrogenase/reductase SDR family protein 12
MPGFRAKFEASLRSSEQGADTVIWLATRPDDGVLENGAFYFDRSVAKKHLPLAGTQVRRAALARQLALAAVLIKLRC